MTTRVSGPLLEDLENGELTFEGTQRSLGDVLQELKGGEKKEPFVVVSSGQSNARGNPNSTGGVFPRSENVYMWLATEQGGAGSWIQDPDFANVTYYMPTTDTIQQSVGGGTNNTPLSLAHRMQVETGRPVYLILDARGGTAIEEWIDQGTASTRFASLSASVAAALLEIPGSPATVDVFTWQQGEANRTDTQTAYKNKLDTLVSQLSAESWYRTNTPFIVGELLRQVLDRYATINIAIHMLGSEDPDAYRYASSQGLPGLADDTHYTGASLYTLGYYRMFDALVSLQVPNKLFKIGNPAGGIEETLWSQADTVMYDVETAGGQAYEYGIDGNAFRISMTAGAGSGTRLWLGDDTNGLLENGAGGLVWFAGSVGQIQLGSTGTFRPSRDNDQQFGAPAGRWANAYAVNFRPGETGGSVIWTSGTGSPEGVVAADPGSMYTDRNGGANVTLYVKESGNASTGWRAVPTNAP